MNECTQVLYRVEDLNAIVEEAPALLVSSIDWRSDYASVASRSDVLKPFLDDLITQFSDTLCHLANAGLMTPNDHAFNRIRDALQDAFDDEYADGWAELKQRAEANRRERIAA